MYVCMYVYVYVCMYVCMCVCMYVCVCVCMCVCVCVCMYVCKTSRPALGLGLPFIVYLGSLPEVNLPGREVNHSPSSSTEVKNAAPMCLHGVERKNLTYK